jgi:predicted RNA-binding Zn-ribbon protein involved in translation (DUF1610 family)
MIEICPKCGSNTFELKRGLLPSITANTYGCQNCCFVDYLFSEIH